MKHILKVVIDCVRFCCVNNLALRGSNCDIGKPGCGIFLNLIGLISKYDSVLSSHLKHKGQITYLSNKIQNEFINLLGSKVRNEIIQRIKNSKYFSIIFDSTPDVSREDQLCEIIRYVREVNNEFVIEESFVDFIYTNEKTGLGIASDVLQKLEKDGLSFKNCRGQGYDNGANMAGKYQGVQARLKEINEHAQFVPCAAHSLNLIGVHAASVSVKMISFFGIVQNIFNYFSGSTSRWEVLMRCLKITLKTHSDTRWASKYNAVHSLYCQFGGVIKALRDISTNPIFGDGVANAESILKQFDLEFVYFLVMWDKILNQIYRVNKLLQSSNISIDQASKMINCLNVSL